MKQKRLLIRTVILILLGVAVAYTLYANFNKDKIQKVEIGSQAPDFVLVDLNGQKHKLSDYKGKGVFLNFWGTWCKPCEREMPYMNNQYKHFKEKGVQILAVNVGESDLAVKKFVERYDLQFPILIDKDSQVQTAYGVNPLPVTFLIDPSGKVVKMSTGTLTESMIYDYMQSIQP
ncbi:thiol-disulfide oxidoreductase ResA [Bacillus sp. CGMCC 1.16607]|uniref:thiol-disulfide oxidoreductase ResA n=1 Tax=Bacillus sp. CGMCC 1.16607 TaxID=3351842 RepID=UPI003636D764